MKIKSTEELSIRFRTDQGDLGIIEFREFQENVILVLGVSADNRCWVLAIIEGEYSTRQSNNLFPSYSW